MFHAPLHVDLKLGMFIFWGERVLFA